MGQGNELFAYYIIIWIVMKINSIWLQQFPKFSYKKTRINLKFINVCYICVKQKKNANDNIQKLWTKWCTDITYS